MLTTLSLCSTPPLFRTPKASSHSSCFHTRSFSPSLLQRRRANDRSSPAAPQTPKPRPRIATAMMEELGTAAKHRELGIATKSQEGSTPPVVKTPVLLFDVMGTIVRDPFYQDVPAFFGISLKELWAVKHPTAWVDFEKGLISEEELVSNFFTDKRGFDWRGLKNCMANGYTYLEGVEALLARLKSTGYQMHAFSNYPSWYELIEDKLALSKYLTWTFISCSSGKRKPDREAYIDAAKQLELSASEIIFIDDQSRNVEAAIQVGMIGLTFENAEKLESDLRSLGLVF